VDVGVSASAITVVMHVLDGSTSLLGVVEEEVTSLFHIPSSSLTAGFKLKCIAAVIETDIGISARTIDIIHACFTGDMVHSGHLFLYHQWTWLVVFYKVKASKESMEDGLGLSNLPLRSPSDFIFNALYDRGWWFVC
jgi:hypothetical protein